MNISFQELAQLFPNNRGNTSVGIAVEEIMVNCDRAAKKGLYVPLVHDINDGHRFLMEAISHGAIAAIWQSDKEVPRFIPTDFPVFFVEDTEKSLRQLAAYYLSIIQPTVIGVAGTAPAPAKRIVHTILSQRYFTHKLTENESLSEPLTILQLPKRADVLIMDVFGDRSEPSPLDYLIVTDNELLERDLANRVKKEGIVFYDGDQPTILRGEEAQLHAIGVSSHCNTQITFLLQTDKHIQFQIGDDDMTYELPFTDERLLKTAIGAIVIAKTLALPLELIKKGVQQLKECDNCDT